MSMPTEFSTEIVTLSYEALQKFKGLLNDKPEMKGIRLGVSGGGCAGLQYDMTPAEGAEPTDMIQVIEDIPFYINPMVVPYLKGIHIEFSDALVDGGFKFVNPNATSTCGCGTSFGV